MGSMDKLRLFVVGFVGLFVVAIAIAVAAVVVEVVDPALNICKKTVSLFSDHSRIHKFKNLHYWKAHNNYCEQQSTYPRSMSLGLIETLDSREGIVSFIFDAMELSGKTRPLTEQTE